MDRSNTYDFLLTFHSTIGLSRIVSEINGDFGNKLQILPTPIYLPPPLRGSPRNFVTSSDGVKKRVMGLPG